MRPIDADALLKKDEWLTWDGDSYNVIHVTDVFCAPTLDVEPIRHGRWIKRPDERICPFCNDRHSYFGGKEKNYCPNCGAKMDLPN